MTQTAPPRLIVAMDFSNERDCLAMARQLDPQLCRLKVGKELFTASGPALVEKLMTLGFDVFLDLKFHDIPNTTAAAVRAAAKLGVWMVNVHASGGRSMLLKCRESLDQLTGPRPLLIGVTLLTSMDERELQEVGVMRSPLEQVLHLARLTKDVGLDGVVCSAQEASTLRAELGPEFCLVTPGIRPASAASDDQKRIMTPAEADEAGAHYLVVGRPITRAEDPVAACRAIAQSLA